MQETVWYEAKLSASVWKTMALKRWECNPKPGSHKFTNAASAWKKSSNRSAQSLTRFGLFKLGSWQQIDSSCPLNSGHFRWEVAQIITCINSSNGHHQIIISTTIRNLWLTSNNQVVNFWQAQHKLDWRKTSPMGFPTITELVGLLPAWIVGLVKKTLAFNNFVN